MKKIVASILCIILISYNSFDASAYYFSGRYQLSGGIKVGYYWLNSNLNEKWLLTWQNGIQLWNNTKNHSKQPTGFNFKKAPSINLAQIICNQYSENDGIMGHVRFFIEGKGLTKKETSPTANWLYTYGYLNAYDLRNEKSYAILDALAAHEVGHSIGLAHDIHTPNSIMCPTSYGRTALKPQEIDMARVRSLYK